MVLKPYHPSVVTDLNILASFKVPRAKSSETIEEYVSKGFKPAIEAFTDVVLKVDTNGLFSKVLSTVEVVELWEADPQPETPVQSVADIRKEILEKTKEEIRAYLKTELLSYSRGKNIMEVHDLVEYLRDVIETDCDTSMEIYMDFYENIFSFSIVGADL